ncbi:MAG: hypothetical protein ABIK65_11770 [Candidatus Eisenbacteria bacterium]
MKRLVSAWVAGALLAAGPAAAHEIHHVVERGEATVVTFTSSRGSAFSSESFEVFRPGETTSFQTGRTDALGRISFLPDREGDWRVRVFSEDGHGADIRFSAGPSGGGDGDGRGDGGRIPAEPSGGGADGGATPPADRTARIVLGLGVILGLFGIFSLIRARRRAP